MGQLYIIWRVCPLFNPTGSAPTGDSSRRGPSIRPSVHPSDVGRRTLDQHWPRLSRAGHDSSDSFGTKKSPPRWAGFRRRGRRGREGSGRTTPARGLGLALGQAQTISYFATSLISVPTCTLRHWSEPSLTFASNRTSMRTPPNAPSNLNVRVAHQSAA